jgi:hypothetical protein
MKDGRLKTAGKKPVSAMPLLIRLLRYKSSTKMLLIINVFLRFEFSRDKT